MLPTKEVSGTLLQKNSVLPCLLANRNIEPSSFHSVRECIWLVDPNSHLGRRLQQSLHLSILSSSRKHYWREDGLDVEWQSTVFPVLGVEIYLLFEFRDLTR